MKSDLDNQQSSVNDMLEQIKKIMSQEQVSTEETHTDIDEEDNILELSEDFVVENNEQSSEKLIEKQESPSANMPNDLFNKIDSLITNSDSDTANKTADETILNEDSKIHEKSRDDSASLESDKSLNIINQNASISTKEINDTLETLINENKIETPIKNILNQTSPITEEPKNNLVSDNVVKESTKVIRELMGAIDKPGNDSLKFRNGSTVEDLVIEIMKPQIAEWLNANLGIIVKKVVEKEVRKLIPREED